MKDRNGGGFTSEQGGPLVWRVCPLRTTALFTSPWCRSVGAYAYSAAVLVSNRALEQRWDSGTSDYPMLGGLVPTRLAAVPKLAPTLPPTTQQIPLKKIQIPQSRSSFPLNFYSVPRVSALIPIHGFKRATIPEPTLGLTLQIRGAHLL